MTNHFPDRDPLKKKKKKKKRAGNFHFMCCELITCLHKQDLNADPIPTGSIHGNSHAHLRGTVHMNKWRNTSVFITIDLHSGAQTPP